MKATEQQLEKDVAVLAEIGDAVARLDAGCLQRVGDTIGVAVEGGECGRPSLEFEGNGIAAGLRLRAHHVGEVCRNCCSGHLSPVCAFVAAP
jgi:hypothetical protein